jgi:hypothetical protein
MLGTGNRLVSRRRVIKPREALRRRKEASLRWGLKNDRAVCGGAGKGFDDMDVATYSIGSRGSPRKLFMKTFFFWSIL